MEHGVRRTYLNAIIKNIEDNYSGCDDISLFGGISGNALFINAYNNEFRNEKQELENNLFEIILDKINEVKLLSYSSGLFGIIQLLKKTNNRMVRALDLSEFDDLVAQRIGSWSGNYLNQGNYDYLHGFSGLLYVYNDLYTNRSIVSKLVDDFLSLGIETDRHIYWKNNDFGKEKGASQVVFGMAHGLISYALILAKCNCKFNLGIEDKIMKIINYHWDNRNEESCISIFPNAISSDGPYEKESRLSWCYGDVGIAAGFLKLALLLKKADVKMKAMEILLKTVQRKDLIKNNIHDTSFCHGVSGLVHIYRTFYKRSSSMEFNEAYLYWLRILKDFYETDKKFQYYAQESGYVNNLSLLEGVSGVGLTLLSTLHEKPLDWEECFLV